jgi:hypothetical protein
MPPFGTAVNMDYHLRHRPDAAPSPISGVAAYPVMFSALFSRAAIIGTQQLYLSAPDLSKLEGPVSSFYRDRLSTTSHFSLDTQLAELVGCFSARSAGGEPRMEILHRILFIVGLLLIGFLWGRF